MVLQYLALQQELPLTLAQTLGPSCRSPESLALVLDRCWPNSAIKSSFWGNGLSTKDSLCAVGIKDNFRGTDLARTSGQEADETSKDIAPRHAQGVGRVGCKRCVFDPRHGDCAAARAGHAGAGRGREEGRPGHLLHLDRSAGRGETGEGAFEAKYSGIAVRVERTGAERVFQRIGQDYSRTIP